MSLGSFTSKKVIGTLIKVQAHYSGNRENGSLWLSWTEWYLSSILKGANINRLSSRRNYRWSSWLPRTESTAWVKASRKENSVFGEQSEIIPFIKREDDVTPNPSSHR